MPRSALSLHKISKPIPESPKAKKKRIKKEAVIKTATKLKFSKHAENRFSERFTKQEETIKKNIVNSIISGKIKHNKLKKCYKIYGNFGIYILGENMVVITVMDKNTGSILDKYYEQVLFKERIAILESLGLKYERIYN